MSAFADEDVPTMPARRVLQLERVAVAVRDVLGLVSSDEAVPVLWLPLIDGVLAEAGIHIYPVNATEIGGDEAATDPQGGPEIHILVREDIYDAIDDPSPTGHRPRATVAHELGHALLHVPVIRTAPALKANDGLLRRVRRSELPAYLDPEWQAWVFALFLLAPRRAIETESARGLSLAAIARKLGVSDRLLHQHAQRLQRAPLGTTIGGTTRHK